MTAFITIDADNDLASIAEASGQPDPEKRFYQSGQLHIDGIEQSALDAAFAAYDSQAYRCRLANEAIAARRYQAEVSGVSVGAMAVYTDRTTQNKLTGAALRASRDSSYSVDWKCQDGTFVLLDAQQIIDLADAVGDYVQACFSREAVLVAEVQAGTYEQSMLDQGWPVQEVGA